MISTLASQRSWTGGQVAGGLELEVALGVEAQVIADDEGDVLGQRDPQRFRAPAALVRDGQCVEITTRRSPVSMSSKTTSKMSRVA